MSNITVSGSRQIMEIIIDRPEKKNALTGEMYLAIAKAIRDAQDDKAVRAVILRGGAENFTAGNDLMDFMAQQQNAETPPAVHLMHAMLDCMVPIIAAVDGFAIGIGTTLLFHCDHVLVTKEAKLRMPFTDLGIVPEFASTITVPKTVGYTKAADLLLRSALFTGEEAVNMHIATQLVDADQLHAAAMELAESYLARSPASVRKSKALLKGDQRQIRAAIETEMKEFTACLHSAETQEVISAMIEKRAPEFSKFA